MEAGQRFHEESMAIGSAALLRAIEAAQGVREGALPAKSLRAGVRVRSVWQEGCVDDPAARNSRNSRKMAVTLERIARKDREAESRRAARDACFRCGTRADRAAEHGCPACRRPA